MLRAMSILSLLVTAQFAFGAPSYADQSEYAERNSISSGDGTLNVIATSGAEVIIVLNADGSPVALPRKEVLASAEKTGAVSKAAEEFLGDAQSLTEDAAIASYLFSQGQYSTSAVMFERILSALDPSSPNYSRVSGLVTASLYGSSRHVEGLKFICTQYKQLPVSDTRYRHAVHAHMRSLAVNLGHKEAERILDFILQNPDCQREDFSPVWIPIHLRDMRDLERSVAPIGGVYGIRDNADKEYAASLLDREDIGFKDYLYFVLGEYEKVIEQFPTSHVYDLALLGAGDRSPYKKAIPYLEEYVEKYPLHRGLALHTMYRRMVEARDFDAVKDLLARYPKENLVDGVSDGRIFIQVDGTTRVWVRNADTSSLSLQQVGLITEFYRECRSLQALVLEPAGFPIVVEKLSDYGDRFKELFASEIQLQGWYGEPHELDYIESCAFDLSGSYLSAFGGAFWDLGQALKTGSDDEVRDVAHKFKRCGDYRQGFRLAGHEKLTEAPYEFCKVLDDVCGEMGGLAGNISACDLINLQDLSAKLLERLYNEEPWDRSNDLFLAGLAHRNSHEYGKFAFAMQEIVDNFPSSSFADDATTELGWYYFKVAGDFDRAEEEFLRTLDQFPEANASDNALNWLVLLELERGNFEKAAVWSARLVVEVASDRLEEIVDRRNGELTRIGEFSTENGIFNGIVVAGSAAPVDWRAGDCDDVLFASGLKLQGGQELEAGEGVCSVEGEKVKSIFGFYEAVLKAKDASLLEVRIGMEDGRQIVLPLEKLGLRSTSP